MSDDDLTHGDLVTVWRCGACGTRTEDLPDGACDCGAERWDERNKCPECGDLMDSGGASDPLGTQVVSYVRCDDCEIAVI